MLPNGTVTFKHIPQQDSPVLALVPFLALLVDPQQASTIIGYLSKHLPLQSEFSHLKRVRKVSQSKVLEILVCPFSSCASRTASPATTGSDSQYPGHTSVVRNQGIIQGGNLEFVPERVQKILQEKGLEDCTVERAVPKYAAPTRTEWEEWCTIWPMSWRKPPAIYCDATGLSDSETREMIKFVAKVNAMIEEYKAVNCAVIVNPLDSTIVAIGIDAGDPHPLHHAIMLALDQVSQACHYGKSPRAEQFASDNHKKFSESGDSQISEGAERLHVEKKLHSCMNQSLMDKESAQPYLCTGYDCYTFVEPCVMCAMALTHSRIRRLIFINKDSRNGAMGGAFRLHGEQSLNHHLTVYQALEQ